MSAEELIVTLEHMATIPGLSRRPGYCRRGGRAFAARHGLNWADFVRDGIPASSLEATGDGMALRIVAWARQCEESKRNGK